MAFDIEKVGFSNADFDDIYERAKTYAIKHAKNMDYAIAVVAYSHGLASCQIAMREASKLMQLEPKT